MIARLGGSGKAPAAQEVWLRMSEPAVPMVDLKAQYARIRGELQPAIERVLASTQFIRGEDCARLEEEFAAWCGVAHACGVANGTDALILALRAYGVGPGDEVVTVANTFIATGEAILLNGARPVFVDVDPETYTMDARQLESAITPRTKVLLPVHLYGHPADMDAIVAIGERHGLPVLEDAAQAHGASIGARRAGALGHAACFSFYPGKNLGAYGDAGMVTSNDAAFVDRVRRMANHGGGTDKYDNVVLGTNSRLDSLQAAVLRVKLRHLDSWDAERRERVARLRRRPDGRPGPRDASRAQGRALRLAPVHGPAGAARSRAGPPGLAGHRHRGALPAADPPPARDGVRGRTRRRPAGVGAPLEGSALAAPLSRAAAGSGHTYRRGDPRGLVAGRWTAPTG